MHSGKPFKLPDIPPDKKDRSRRKTLPVPLEGKPAVPARETPPAVPMRVPVPVVERPKSPPISGRSSVPTKPYVGSTVVNSGDTSAKESPFIRPVLLKLTGKDLDPETLRTSMLAHTVTQRQLPMTVKLAEKNSCDGCSVVLEKGSFLQLHYLYKTQRIFATDVDGNGYFLPLQAYQLYTVLPIDPVHDDRLYSSTLALIKTRPLPGRVRIEEAHFSDHPGESQECGDIIEIEKIEKRPVPIDSDYPLQKCVIGTCNNVPIAFSESMDCASYSTMPSIDFMSLSEIVKKFPLPLRVRKADNPAYVMMLHRLDEEYHVVTTSTTLNYVLSIPATWDGQIEVVDNAPLEDLLQRVLPPLYTLVNTTCGLREPGRLDLQTNMQQVAQPLIEVLDGWSRTKEGQAYVFKSTTENVNFLKMRIEELMEGKTRLNNELKLYRIDPPAPPRREDVPTQKPAVPPRPPSASTPTSPKERVLGEDTGAYEEPFLVINKGRSHVKSSKAQEELKALLGARESENKRLQDKIKRLEGENRTLDGKNISLVEEIRTLQIRLDKAEADPTYDTLDDERVTGNYYNRSNTPLYGDSGVLRAGSTLSSYDEAAVGNLLRDMKFEKYVPNFRENSVNGELLATLDEEDLYGELGMGRIHAKRLMLEVKKRMK